MHDPTGPRDFATTHWSLVIAARPGQASEARARRALEELCRSYWYPLYAFVRYSGHDPDDAQDLTQAFFTQIVEKGGFATADPERGRFRSYLLGAMKHFLTSEWRRGRAQKRGGRMTFIDWDALQPETRYAEASLQAENAEDLLDREWAMETVAGALRALREEMGRAGKSALFEQLEGTLTGEGNAPREELATRLGMSEGGVKVAIHRLRRRYRELLRATIAETVGSEAELEDEMRHLIAILRKP